MRGTLSVVAMDQEQVKERGERAYATFLGLAIGDALGMPTQSLSRDEIVAHFGELVTTFYPANPDHPFAGGLRAGTITDDTEQAVVLASLLIQTPGDFDPLLYARRLLEWEDNVRARGLLDLLGPSTKRALERIEQGMDPRDSGSLGTTNGAAMRIAPVGIMNPSGDLPRLIDRVIEVSAVTHNTASALSGAAAVAAVISSGIDGADLESALATGVQAAEFVERRYEPLDEPRVSEALVTAIDFGHSFEGVSVIDEINRHVGTSLETVESVPAAFAVSSPLEVMVGSLASLRPHSVGTPTRSRQWRALWPALFLARQRFLRRRANSLRASMICTSKY